MSSTAMPVDLGSQFLAWLAQATEAAWRLVRTWTWRTLSELASAAHRPGINEAAASHAVVAQSGPRSVR